MHLPVSKINVIYIMHAFIHIYYIYTYTHIYIYIYIYIQLYNGIIQRSWCMSTSSIFMLNLTGNKYSPNNIGLYRDGGLAIFKNGSGRNLNKLKRLFKKCLKAHCKFLILILRKKIKQNELIIAHFAYFFTCHYR